MRILIMGAGALGSVFGGFLSKGHEVTLIGRRAHMKAINESGLRVSGIWGDHLFSNMRVCTSPKDVEERQDFILITTKSYDTKRAVEDVRHLLKGDSRVISMQNGIGNEDTVAEVAGRQRTLGGMAIFGAALPEPGHVEVTVYASECLLGPLGGRDRMAHVLAKAITEAGIPTLVSDDIIRDKWMKAFYNIALNPLSAILKVPYGVLGEYQETRDIMYWLLNESFQVAGAEGIQLKFDLDGYFKYFLERQIPPTAGHRSSMLQDIEQGKKTEIDYLNGRIIALARRHGIETPVNHTITSIIKVLEKT
jgi:2-dehydropantoate 2-reductase